jgi:hypothetical protein
VVLAFGILLTFYLFDILMEELIDKKRIEAIRDMDFNKESRTISRRLQNVYDILESKYNYIQYQNNEIEENKRDYDAPSEGLHPGYDNGIRISPIKTSRVIKRCVGELNEYSIYATDDVVYTKQDIISRCEQVEQTLSNLNTQDRVIDQKEEVLKEIAKALSDTVELFEEMKDLNS